MNKCEQYISGRAQFPSNPPRPVIEVFDLLKAQDSEAYRGSRHLRYLGLPLCNRGFIKLFGLGKNRFNTLNGAARRGEEHCPHDQRYVPRGKKVPSEKWVKVSEFLMRLYLEIAEPIPDGLNSNKRPRLGTQKLDGKHLDRSKIKHLPHGSINDYWRQCTAALPNLGVSRKFFCTETLAWFDKLFYLSQGVTNLYNIYKYPQDAYPVFQRNELLFKATAWF